MAESQPPAAGDSVTDRVLAGFEYQAARAAADRALRAMHESNPSLRGLELNHIKLVKFGGDPADLCNRIALTRSEPAPYTSWWRQVQRNMDGNWAHG